MQKDIEITIAPEFIEQESYLIKSLANALKVDPIKIKGHKILKRSIDARSRKVIYRLQVRVFIDEAPLAEIFKIDYQNVRDAKHVIIVGAALLVYLQLYNVLKTGLSLSFWSGARM